MELKYPKVTLKRIQDVWDKLGGEDGVDKLLRDELEEGVAYFSVESDGTTGPEWEQWYDENKYFLSKDASFILRSPDFKPTNGMTTEVAVLKGMLFKDNDRITRKIRAEAGKRKLSKPNAELACLIRELLTDEEIEARGLGCIVAMHEPINNSDGVPRLLGAYRCASSRGLLAYGGKPDYGWCRDYGFAFAVSQVGSQS